VKPLAIFSFAHTSHLLIPVPAPIQFQHPDHDSVSARLQNSVASQDFSLVHSRVPCIRTNCQDLQFSRPRPSSCLGTKKTLERKAKAVKSLKQINKTESSSSGEENRIHPSHGWEENWVRSLKLISQLIN